MLEIIKCLMLGVLTGACVGVGRELCLGALLQQTLVKWPTFWQQKHVWLKAQHWDQPAG